MTVVVLGIDALDPDLVDPDDHPNLTPEGIRAIDTIPSSNGYPSTHELWPTIITGLPPAEHGLLLSDGVAWNDSILNSMSSIADHVLPDALQTRLGAWLLTNTGADAFRTPATYYRDHGLETVFDGRETAAIGVPNYVLDTDTEDREHQLRRGMGELFERDPDAQVGHRSRDPGTFYERCMEMVMVRIARVRRALRGRRYELVFGYTSGLDLIGHVSHDRPALQRDAYDELDQFVGELVADLHSGDVLILVSDHGLQDGFHTQEAMFAGTDSAVVDGVEHITDVRSAIETALESGDHTPDPRRVEEDPDAGDHDEVVEQLEDLGYL